MSLVITSPKKYGKETIIWLIKLRAKQAAELKLQVIFQFSQAGLSNCYKSQTRISAVCQHRAPEKGAGQARGVSSATGSLHTELQMWYNSQKLYYKI